MLRHSSGILLINIEGSDLHIDHSGLNVSVPHKLHERGQADAGPHHIGGEGMAEPMWVGHLYASGPTMVSEQRAQPRGSHPCPASRPLERKKQSVSYTLGALQPQIVIKE